MRQLNGNGGVLLTVEEATEADSGPYTCQIMVKRGQKKITHEVMVGDFPDEETTTEATEAASVGDGGGAAGVSASLALVLALALSAATR